MKRSANCGFTLIEALIVVAIGIVLTAIAVPVFNGAMSTYKFNAAVSAATGAIQSTRYAAIMHGYSYEITFTPANRSYQIFSMIPPATTYSAQVTTGGTTYPTQPIPITGSGDITISRQVTFQFAPGGTVTETSTTPNLSFSITNTSGRSNTITVSGVGNVSVTSP